MQHTTSYYNYIHASLAEYVNPSDLALVAVAVVGWAVTFLVRRLFSTYTVRLAMQRALAQKQQEAEAKLPEGADSDDQPCSGAEQQPLTPSSPPRRSVKANAEARRRARKQQRAQATTEAPIDATACDEADSTEEVQAAQAEEAAENAAEEPAIETAETAEVAPATVRRQKRKNRKAQQAQQAQLAQAVEAEVAEPAAEQDAPAATETAADEAQEAQAEEELVEAEAVQSSECLEAAEEKKVAPEDDGNVSGDSTDADEQSSPVESEESSSSVCPSRTVSTFMMEEQGSTAGSCDGAQKEEVKAEVPEEAFQPEEPQEAADAADDEGGDSSTEEEDETSSLFAQVPEAWLSDEAVAPQAMTPLRKEVMKLEKRLRKVRSLEARRSSGEKLDTLQLEAIARSKDLDAELQMAKHNLAVEEATLFEQPSHYYLWDAQEEPVYYCMPANMPEDGEMAMYATMPAWEQTECQQQWSPSWHGPASWAPQGDGWMNDFEAPQQPTWGGRHWGSKKRPSWFEDEKDEDWDLCWSFHNKGFCARGANCTWRHEGDEKADTTAPLSQEEKEELQQRVEELNSEQLDAIFEFLAPDLNEADGEEEVTLDPDMLTPSRQRALFKLVERAQMLSEDM